MNQEVYDLINLIQNKYFNKAFMFHKIIFENYKISIWNNNISIGKKGTGLRISISRRDLANKFEGERLEDFKFLLEEELLKIL